ncbi:MAG: DUF2254 domain-containing protein [Methanoregula sp.]
MRFPLKSRIASRNTWDRIRVNFLFIPGAMALGAVLLAWLMYWLDGQIPNEVLNTSRFIISGNVDELRGYLFNMATTVLTTAGIVFTLLTLPLSTVASQYGSRLLRIFLGDRTTQFVLGMFVATFAYCIFSALGIPPVELQPEGAQITTTVGLYLLIAAFASLILLIQHISMMLQAPNIAAAAGAELQEVVRETNLQEAMSGEYKRQPVRIPQDSLKESEAHPVRATEAGYIQYVDPEYILPLAEKKDIVIHIVARPGAFVRSGMVIGRVWPADRVDNELEDEIRNTFHLGNQRTPTQDVEYAVNQLTEMAVRAMSPAINDPFTAMTCLDYIGDGLALFARQGAISPNIYDSQGRLRLVFNPAAFDELLSAAFDMLRHASSDNARVLLHMLEIIDVISHETKSPEERQDLLRHVTLIQMESQAGDLIEEDRQSIRLFSEALHLKLKGPV